MRFIKRDKTLFLAFGLLVMLTASNVQAGTVCNQRVLIEPATLQNYIDVGRLNCVDCVDKVVLLDVTDPMNYATGHIPGAQLWDVAEQVQTRVEGPAPAVNMVLDGAQMDAMLQKHGIEANTTIVITSSKTQTYFPSRAYFLFRYWGFPKKQLKVLNGYNGVWDPHDFTTEPTVVTPSTFSVRDRRMFRPDERVSLNELITAVKLGIGVPVDMRGDKTAAGSTPGVFSDVSGDFVVFEGRIRGGKGFVWRDFNLDYDGGDFRFKPAEEIAAELTASGIDGTDVVFSYCRTGYIGSVGYFVLDGILGWDVMTYDGSWSQWGKMSDIAGLGGELPQGSLWATDTYELMEVINYNADAGLIIETLRLDEEAHTAFPNPSDPFANQVELEDALYILEGLIE